MKIRSGFTLVEIMIVAICMALLMGPVFMVLRSGTQTSLKGMLRIDTTLEARRVIRQVHADLKMACFPLPLSSVFNFDDVLKTSGTPPKNVYNFLSYPSHQKMSEIFTSQTSGINFRDLSEITYTVEDNGDPEKPSLKLTREEKFGGKTTKRILSNRVNFFEIKPIMLQPQGKNQYYYFVTLQLLDAVHPSEMQGNTPGEKISDEVTGVILADFFDVVYPEYFHSMWNQLRTVPNWHTLLRSPGG